MGKKDLAPVLGLHLGVRAEGSAAKLLESFQKGVRKAGAQMEILSVHGRKIEGCRACGGCEKTGHCVIGDDMGIFYEALETVPRLVVSAPVYFYGVPAQGKAMIDRLQVFWARQYRLKQKRDFSHPPKGFVLSVGGTKGADLFVPIVLCTKYMFDSLSFPKKFPFIGFRKIEEPGDLSFEQLARIEKCGEDFALDRSDIDLV
ncbi:MAG: flavodoxin family protein [Deltaproteobacteria bacterium]|jgi:multimeric flavodoxin WrbA|nr:flavodoxin family protein [Deltaproteobacteria bacterium]